MITRLRQWITRNSPGFRLFDARRWSIRAQLVTLVGALVLAFIGLVAYQVFSGFQHGEEQARASARRLARVAAGNVQEYLHGSARLLAAAAGRLSSQGLDKTVCAPLLNELMKLDTAALSLAVYDERQQLVCVSTARKAAATFVPLRPEQLRGLDQRSFSVIGPVRYPDPRTQAAVLAYPVPGESGAPQGAVAVRVKLSDLYPFRQQSSLPQDAVLLIVAPDGTVLGNAREGDGSRRPGGLAPALLAKIGASKEGSTTYSNAGGVRWIYGFAAIPQTGWYVLAELPGSVASAWARSEIVLSGSVSLFAVVLVIGFAMWIARNIERPIRLIGETAGEIAHGNFRARASAGGTREIDEVAKQFNEMLDARAKFEKELVASERRYRNLLETAEEGIWVLNPNHETEFANERVAFMLGYDRAELSGRSCFEFMDEHWRGIARRVLEPSQRGVREQQEFRLVRKDGSDLWVLLTANPLYDENGRQTGSLMILSDITGRKQSEMSLQETANKFVALLRSGPLPIIALDRSLNVVMWNPAAERVFGWSEAEVLGKPSPIVPEEAGASNLERQRLELAGKSFSELEVRRVKKDGTLIDMTLWSGPVYGADGKIAGIMGIFLDISERKRAEERFRLAVEAAPNAMIMVAAQGQILLSNAQAERLFGYSSRELLDMRVEQLVPQRFRSAHLDIRTRFMMNPQSRSIGAGRDLHALRKDGTEVPVEIGLNPLQVGGSLVVLASVIDITERKRAEEDSRAYTEQLAGLSRRLVELQEEERRKLASELHDRVGQNLAALNVNLALLRNGLPPEAAIHAERRLNDCIQLIETTGETISDVLAELRPPMLASFGLLVSLRWNAAQFTQRTGIAAEVRGAELSPRLQPEIELALFRITQESLANVMKHARATRVSISLEQHGDKVRLSIADNGVGFDPGQSRLAGRWGLATMRERAETARGTLRIDSAPGRGTLVAAEVGRSVP